MDREVFERLREITDLSNFPAFQKGVQSNSLDDIAKTLDVVRESYPCMITFAII